ncbi:MULTISPECIES: glycoside hydrolase family 108 protein [Xanthomonas]|uniref:N-acetylmuramidase n=1 Tax=Xanthomonas cucurbitae TaxID=56453 RepID=A0ABY7YGZ8_9XANT|nr:glycosyl hydrolase 108 family protein [Xanthomonas cucurbitae]QHG86757.1 N-acetylmuramidase [Xanthomonas cucurbitae]WDM69086.1 N-acetylmuramidase [Xanthomonas cucurbitae]WDM72957.1 N-acetylmuramidase [Xanthomonas cucurbitae]WDM76666.1 N-acetylmuramidase [Xanthomonas cucurbitae]
MADFMQFFPTFLRFQGGFVDAPDDPGGATNMGISLAAFSQSAQATLGVQPSLETLQQLTVAQAATFYKTLYWDKLQGDAIQLQPLADILFYFYTEAGSAAAKLLQTLLGEMGQQVPIDGTFSAQTLAALQQVDQTQLYLRYKQGCVDYYTRLVAARPFLQRFLKGWLTRIASFPELS